MILGFTFINVNACENHSMDSKKTETLLELFPQKLHPHTSVQTCSSEEHPALKAPIQKEHTHTQEQNINGLNHT